VGEDKSLPDTGSIFRSSTHPSEVKSGREGGGEEDSKRHKRSARVRPTYSDREEEYVLVTNDDLREIATFSRTERVLWDVGLFFVSGAFWLLIELIAHQASEEKKFEITSWMIFCAACVVMGAAVMYAGHSMRDMKSKRLSKYIDLAKSPSANNPSIVAILDAPARR